MDQFDTLTENEKANVSVRKSQIPSEKRAEAFTHVCGFGLGACSGAASVYQDRKQAVHPGHSFFFNTQKVVSR